METEKIIYTAALTKLTQRHFANAKLLALFMVAQSKHESNNYQSHIFLTANNAFGYAYYAKSPYQVAKGPIADNKAPAAKYKTVADSAREIADWIGRREASFMKVTTIEEYCKALKYWGYFQDSLDNYTAGVVRNFKEDIQPIIDPLT